MANIYNGVPIGGTIMWMGSLVGLPIPDNYVVNYGLGSYTNARRDSYFTATQLPSKDGYYVTGLGDTSVKFQEQENKHSFTLIRSQLPYKNITKASSDFPVFSVSGAEMDTLWENDFDTYTNTVTSEAGDSDGNLYTDNWKAAYTDSGWNQEHGPNDLGGSTKFYVWASSSNKGSGIEEDGKHYHGSGSYTHSHKTSEVTGLEASTSWNDRDRLIFNTNGTQTEYEYQVNTPAVGVVLITRVF